ncbi:MAG: hypothetical protein JSR59_03235 [Proteobacteria bacterium]|nr:hypothetical protein [Pseudomonadota bacterium]
MSQIPQPKQYFADAHRAVAYGGIEWEELPSLAAQLAARKRRTSGRADLDARLDARAEERGTAWDDTLPGAFDGADSAPTPFREPLEGLATREVTAPEIFRHFFGDGA